jgi:hypothetical protein
MKISKNTWHYRVFNSWYRETHYGTSFEDCLSWGHQPYVNLCPYVRAVLLWTPLRWLFSTPRLWFTLSVLLATFAGAIYHFTGLQGLEAVGAFVGSIAAISGLILGVIWVVDEIRSAMRVHPSAAITKFSTVLKARMKVAHDGICPAIEFVDDKPIETPKPNTI